MKEIEVRCQVSFGSNAISSLVRSWGPILAARYSKEYYWYLRTGQELLWWLCESCTDNFFTIIVLVVNLFGVVLKEGCHESVEFESQSCWCNSFPRRNRIVDKCCQQWGKSQSHGLSVHLTAVRTFSALKNNFPDLTSCQTLNTSNVTLHVLCGFAIWLHVQGSHTLVIFINNDNEVSCYS